MTSIHARLINQLNFISQTVIPTRFTKKDEDALLLDEI